MHPRWSGLLVLIPTSIIYIVLNKFFKIENIILYMSITFVGTIITFFLSRHFSKKYYADNDDIRDNNDKNE